MNVLHVTHLVKHVSTLSTIVHHVILVKNFTLSLMMIRECSMDIVKGIMTVRKIVEECVPIALLISAENVILESSSLMESACLANKNVDIVNFQLIMFICMKFTMTLQIFNWNV